MQIGRLFSWLTDGNSQTPPKTSKRELFNRDGFGPTRFVFGQPPRKYKGPTYPELKRPRSYPASDESKALCNLARKAWSNAAIPEAEALYDRAAWCSPQNPDFLFEKAQLLWSEFKKEEARQALEQALVIDPNQYRALVSLALLATGRADKKEALELLPRIEACNPGPPQNIASATATQVRRLVFGIS